MLVLFFPLFFKQLTLLLYIFVNVNIIFIFNFIIEHRILSILVKNKKNYVHYLIEKKNLHTLMQIILYLKDIKLFFFFINIYFYILNIQYEQILLEPTVFATLHESHLYGLN